MPLRRGYFEVFCDGVRPEGWDCNCQVNLLVFHRKEAIKAAHAEGWRQQADMDKWGSRRWLCPDCEKRRKENK